MSSYAVAPTRELPNIGWDPCPGSVEDTRSVSSLIGDFSTQASEMSDFIDGRGDNTDKWTGKSFESFRTSMEDFPAKLRLVAEAFGTASTALSGWADRLQEMQDRSLELDRQLGEKREALDVAQSAVTGWLERGDDEDVVNDNVEVRDAAQDEMREVERQIETLHDEYLETAVDYAEELDAAGDTAWGGSWWDAIKDGWSDFKFKIENSVFGDIGRALAPLASWVSEVGGWVSVISLAAAGVCLVIPGAQLAIPVLVAVAGISGGIATAGDVALAASGYEGWGPVGMSALTFGIGNGVTKVATKKIIKARKSTTAPGQLVQVTGPRGRTHEYVPSLFRMDEIREGEAVWHAVRLKGSQAEWTITGIGMTSSLQGTDDADPWDLPRGAAYVEVGVQE